MPETLPAPLSRHPPLKRTIEVSKSEMYSQIQISKIIIQPLWLCIQLRLYSSLHYITLKHCFRNIFLPKIHFYNRTLLQTACNGVKHHRKLQAYNRKAAIYQQLQTKHTNILLVYKSNRIKEYILKSEVKINRLKNLEGKKNMYIYLQVNRLNIIQVWLATKVHKIQHYMTFSFVDPKLFLKDKIPYRRPSSKPY